MTRLVTIDNITQNSTVRRDNIRTLIETNLKTHQQGVQQRLFLRAEIQRLDTLDKTLPRRARRGAETRKDINLMTEKIHHYGLRFIIKVVAGDNTVKTLGMLVEKITPEGAADVAGLDIQALGLNYLVEGAAELILE
jgi:hypothetical protein